MPTDPANDRYPVQVARGGEPYDQYINTNFDALATEVPTSGTLANRPAATGEFAPSRYYATDEGTEYFNTGTSWKALSLSPEIQAARDGHVSVIAQGTGVTDAIDPATTGTPVQDAVDLAAGGGYVIIPPEGVEEDTQVSVPSYVSIVGFGPGGTNNPTSEIKFVDAVNDCLVLENADGSSVDFNLIDGIHITGPSYQNPSGIGLNIPDKANQVRIGHVDITDVGNEAFHVTSWNELMIDQLRCSQVEPQQSGKGQAIDFEQGGAGGTARLIAGYPFGSSTDSSLERFVRVGSGQMNIQYLNVGGVCRRAIITNANSSVHIGGINHEPSALSGQLSTSENAFAAVQNYGPGVTTVDHVQITAGTGSITWEDVYVASGTNTAGWEFGIVRKAAPVNGFEVRVDTDTSGYMPCIWHGRSNQITNSSATSPLTNPVACLGDLTQFTG